MKKLLILIGPPGSGKGTQAKLLKRNYGFQLINSGDLLRTLSEGRKDVANSLKSGELVEQRIVEGVIREALLESRKNNLLLDGYPRSREQLEFLRTLDSIEIRLTIFLEVEEREELFKRVSNRLYCSKCNSSVENGSCQNCGRLYLKRRDDDRRETVERRLLRYEQLTLPLLKENSAELRLQIVNAGNSVESVYARIDTLVKRYYLRENER
jgi:adenylate kinase